MPEFTLGNGSSKIPLLFDLSRELCEFGAKYQKIEDLIPFPSHISSHNWQNNPIEGPVGAPVFNWPSPPPLELNQLYWPCTGMSRFAYGLFFITQASKNAMYWWPAGPLTLRSVTGTAIDPVTGATTAETTVQIQGMYPLTARRVSNPKVTRGLYLLPLVDRRYFLQFRDAGDIMESLMVDDGSSYCQEGCTAAWEDLFDHLEAQLGVSLAVDDVYATYLAPDCRTFAKQYHSATQCLDAAAASVGMRVVAKLDGTYEVQTSTTAQSDLDDDMTLLETRQVSGFKDDDVTARYLPETVRVCFPKVRYNHFKTPPDYYIVDTVTSGESSGFGVISGSVKTYHSSAVADFGSAESEPSTPINSSDLASLAARITQDYVGWRETEYDFSLGRPEPWDPCGFDDHILFIFGREVCDDLFAMTDVIQDPNSPAVHADTFIGKKYRRDHYTRVQSFRLDIDVDSLYQNSEIVTLPDSVTGITAEYLVESTWTYPDQFSNGKGRLPVDVRDVDTYGNLIGEGVEIFGYSNIGWWPPECVVELEWQHDCNTWRVARGPTVLHGMADSEIAAASYNAYCDELTLGSGTVTVWRKNDNDDYEVQVDEDDADVTMTFKNTCGAVAASKLLTAELNSDNDWVVVVVPCADACVSSSS